MFNLTVSVSIFSGRMLVAIIMIDSSAKCKHELELELQSSGKLLSIHPLKC